MQIAVFPLGFVHTRVPSIPATKETLFYTGYLSISRSSIAPRQVE